MAVDCVTMNLMQVLRRFLSIRGFPAIILSDNGSQMTGAAKELCDMVNNLKGDQLGEFCSERSIQWVFTTPAVSH